MSPRLLCNTSGHQKTLILVSTQIKKAVFLKKELGPGASTLKRHISVIFARIYMGLESIYSYDSHLDREDNEISRPVLTLPPVSDF